MPTQPRAKSTFPDKQVSSPFLNSRVSHTEIAMGMAGVVIGPMKGFLEEGRLGISLCRSDVRIGQNLKIIGIANWPDLFLALDF
jgi:hypothetical protein